MKLKILCILIECVKFCNLYLNFNVIEQLEDSTN